MSATALTDRVAILAAFKNAGYDQSDPTLSLLVDYFHFYLFPRLDISPSQNIAGYDGDPAYVRIPFLVSNDGTKEPILNDVTIQIVAVKAGASDFILEEQKFDASTTRVLNGGQDLSQTMPKYNGILGQALRSTYGISSLIRSSDLDVPGYAGYLITYGFVLRYEYWLQSLILTQSSTVAVARDIENLTEVWSNFTQSGWSLVFRMSWNVKNTVTGYVQGFVAEQAMEQKKTGADPDTGPIFTSETKFYIQLDDLSFQEVNGIQRNGRTMVRYICNGDLTAVPTGTPDGFGYIFADLENSGGSNNRRMASTDTTAEADTPWSVTENNEFGDNPTSTYTNGDLRLNTYDTTKIIVEGWYDDTRQGWGNRERSILIYCRLDFWTRQDLRQFADLVLHNWNDGEQTSF